MELIHFGIDHLRLNFSVKRYPSEFEEFFEGLSANSNFKGVFWHDIMLLVVFSSTKQKHILNFTYDGIPVLCLEKIIDDGIGRNYSYILKFHSSFFHFSELRNILNRLLTWDYRHTLTITRLDICLDVNLGVQELVDKGYKTQFRVKEERKRSDVLQTLYLGTRNATNKKHFIRAYNKQLDTEKKAKHGLYLDYFAYENVTRVELQINSQSCKEFGITVFNVWDAEFLKTVYKSCCINPKGTHFLALDVPEFDNLEILRRKAPPKSEILDKLQYAKVMLGYAQNLTNVGFDTLSFLKKHLKSKQ